MPCERTAARLDGASSTRRFDARALWAALDEQRTARGLTWGQVAREIGVSASTIARLRQGARFEVDGMIAMVSWLKMPVERFVHEDL